MRYFKTTIFIVIIILCSSCNRTNTEHKLKAKIDSLNAVINSLKQASNSANSNYNENYKPKINYCVIYITALFANQLNSETGVLRSEKTAYSPVIEVTDTTEDNLYRYMDSFEKTCKTQSTFGELKVIKRDYRLFNTYKSASLFIEENTNVETQ